MSDLEEQKPGVSRRTVAKAMAWSVPAVALAVPAPAYAASPGIITVNGAGCKLPGTRRDVFKGYAFRATISNTTNAQITVTITDMTLNGDDLGSVGVIRLSPLHPGNEYVRCRGEQHVRCGTRHPECREQFERHAPHQLHGGWCPGQQATTSANACPPIQGSSCDAFSAGEKPASPSSVPLRWQKPGGSLGSPGFRIPGIRRTIWHVRRRRPVRNASLASIGAMRRMAGQP